MLNHKKNIILLVVLLVALLAGVYFLKYNPWILLIPCFVFLFIEVSGASMLAANFHFISTCTGGTKEKKVALTFDDGPHGAETEKVLTVLKKHEASATFFCIGKKAEQDRELILKIDKAGHLIANHSYTHSFFFNLQNTKMLQEEIDKTNACIEGIIGKKPLFFRPPYGVATPALGRAIKNTNMSSIGWDIRPFDTSIQNPEKIVKKITNEIKPGSIILLHDRIRNSDKTVDLLLQFLSKNNYQVVSLDNLLNTPAYA
ncbi:MAG: polysaccharide deacetylase family protein [Bacteroidetes bacterium]|nr:polysaccharide deacetylase family protein [Bacteroidota bacterium]